MYFQVNISPVEKVKKKTQTEKEVDEIAILSLAPFTRKPSICFNNIQAGTVGSKKLIIKNPTSQDIKLYVTRSPPVERSLLLSWHEQVIPSEDEVLLELQWSPIVEGGWSDTITFEDGHRLKKDVSVIFKCLLPKKIKNKPSKSGRSGVSKKIKSPVNRKSPKKSNKLMNRSPTQMSRHVFPDITNIPSFKFDSPKSYNSNSEIEEIPRRETYSVKDKENFNISAFQSVCNDDVFLPPVSSTFSIDRQEHVHQDIVLKDEETRSNILNPTKQNSVDNFEDSLEMVSPNINKISTCNSGRKRDNKMESLSPFSTMQEKLKHVVFSPNCTTPTVFTAPHFLFEGTPITSCNRNSLKVMSPYHNDDMPLEECTYTKDNISTDKCGSPNICSNTFTKDESLNGNDGVNKCNPQINNSANMGLSFKSTSPNVFNEEINLSRVFSNCTVNRINDLRGENARNTLEANLWCGYNKPVLEQIIEESYISDSEIDSTHRKRKSDTILRVCQPKRLILEPFFKPKVSSTPSLQKSFKKVTSLNIKQFLNKSKLKDTLEPIEEKPVTLHDPDSFLASISNPLVLTATNSIDPFMSTMYCNPKWVKEQEIKFTNWINALVTPPMDLNSNPDGHPIDVAKLWQQCKRQEMSKAPTKEVISNKYHVTSHIDSLRRSSIQLFRSEHMSQILMKACMMVENQKLYVRKDKNVHLDIGLQAAIMELFLSYNPLWLRIGLETIYGMTIPLHSNSDIMGLSLFISEHFFKDANLLKKYKTVHSPKYSIDIKKKILQKFLMLVYFLDQAKLKQLVSHDPCLFCKNAPIKDSREILLKFSAELISAVGDVTKYLKCTGYTLSHKQTYINEFDYAVTDLGSDLKDGVRLTRVTEIILLVNGLVNALRVPAISRLQKIHNVKIVFDALEKAGFDILYDIMPKDIVEGHKEKTLSFLWQIIFKFQAPRLTKAAKTIQAWWRCLPVVIKRRNLTRGHQRREAAAMKIQKWFKRTVFIAILEKFVPLLRQYIELQRTESAAVKIQSYVRMRQQQKRYLQVQKTALGIQCYARRLMILKYVLEKVTSIIKIQAFARMYLARSKYLKIKTAVLKIEEFYTAKKIMSYQRDKYQKLKSTVLFMQGKFRANRQMKVDRSNYLKLKSSVVTIQQKYKATIAMKKVRNCFCSIKHATILIQNTFRANKLMEKDRSRYLDMKTAAIVIQKYYRANKLAQKERLNYLKLKNAVLVVTNRYLANKAMAKERRCYLKLKCTVMCVQQKFRANKVMNLHRHQYQNLKSAVLCIQRKHRANILMHKLQQQYQHIRSSIIILQRRYKANVLMRKQRKQYIHFRNCVLKMQRRYRATKLMQTERTKYLTLRNSAIIVQRQYKAKKIMDNQRDYYCRLRQAVFIIKSRYLANKAGKTQRQYYEKLKSAVLCIQTKYRAYIAMRTDRNSYSNLKLATISIQSHFRAIVLMRKQQEQYKNFRHSVIKMQRRYRATKLMQTDRIKYLTLRNSAIIVQRQYKAKKIMEKQRHYYCRLRQAVFIIKSRYLANKAMNAQCRYYKNLKSAVLHIETKYRANIAMRADRNSYSILKSATISIQSHFRANILMQKQREQYKHLRNSVIKIQRHYRATKLMQKERNKFLNLRNSTIIVQRQYRANKLMKLAQMQYKNSKKSIVYIQNTYRANCLMIQQRKNYQNLRKATIVIQLRYRATLLMKIQSNHYKKLKQSVLVIQRSFRANKARHLRAMIKATTKIQRWFRGIKLMKIEQNNFKKYLHAVKFVQRCFRSKIEMNGVLNKYNKTRAAAVVIQSHYRAFKLMKIEQNNFSTLRRMTIIIQRRYRANVAMKREYRRYQGLKKAVQVIQAKYKANKIRHLEQNKYCKLQAATLVIQKYFKSYLKMKKDKIIYERKRQTLILVQSYIRSYLVRKQYEQVLQEKKRVRNLKNRAATKIATIWRGYQIRSKCNEKLTHIRMNVQKANECAVQENTLGYLRDKALGVLHDGNQGMLDIYHYLRHLDVVTRTCKNTCKNVSELLSEQLYNIIVSTARSLPDMNVCTLATNILINCCKYSELNVNCWYPNYIDKLFTEMMHCCDKENVLFLNLCTIIWLFAHNEQYKTTMKNMPNLQERIAKVKQLCLRKHKMVTRCTIKHNSIFRTYTNLPLPSLVPDWGIDYKSRPRTFGNALHSLNSICSILDIK